jgi:hypothetical protein
MTTEQYMAKASDNQNPNQAMPREDLANFFLSHGLPALAQKARIGGYDGLPTPKLRLIVDLHAAGRPDLARRVRMEEIEERKAILPLSA